MTNFKKTFVVGMVLFILHYHDLFPKQENEVPLYYWQSEKCVNFGDYLSLKLVERIVGRSVDVCSDDNKQKKLLAIGSILTKASNNDVVWGSGIKRFDKQDYKFNSLDIRAVRGPITRKFIIDNFHIHCPEVYGDPALLVPYFFPEFKKKKNPKYDYLIIPHYRKRILLFPKNKYQNVVYPTDPWDQVIKKIVDSKFVISGSLHGLIIAEAYGIPARMLKTDDEPMLKYEDYYLGTNRKNFRFATSVEQALRMGGEQPFKCDLKKLYAAFPFDLWSNAKMKTI